MYDEMNCYLCSKAGEDNYDAGDGFGGSDDVGDGLMMVVTITNSSLLMGNQHKICNHLHTHQRMKHNCSSHIWSKWIRAVLNEIKA